MGSLSFKLRTVRARGDREQVLGFARREICREDGIPPERCTAEMFLPKYEWCDGDPRPSPTVPGPEVARMAEQIRRQIPETQADGGTAAADAGAGGAPNEADAPPAADAGAAAPDGGVVLL